MNLAAKLEKHNAALGSRALATRHAYDTARQQGYRPAEPIQDVPAARVEGVHHPVDAVRLA